MLTKVVGGPDGLRAVQRPVSPATAVTGISAAMVRQIASTMQQIVTLTAARKQIQGHIDALRSDIEKLDPALVRSIAVAGYPPPT